MPRNKQAAPVEPVDPDAGMRRDGDPKGSPSVRFCPERRANYHLDGDGRRIYHGVPDGFEFDDAGVLHRVGEPPAPAAPQAAAPVTGEVVNIIAAEEGTGNG